MNVHILAYIIGKGVVCVSVSTKIGVNITDILVFPRYINNKLLRSIQSLSLALLHSFRELISHVKLLGSGREGRVNFYSAARCEEFSLMLSVAPRPVRRVGGA